MIRPLAPLGPHDPRRFGRAGEGAAQIERHHVVPLVVGDLKDRPAIDRGGRGHDDVEPAESLARGAHELAARRGLAQVRLQGKRSSAQRLDLRHDRCRHLRPAVVVDRNVCALAGERERDRAPDAVAARAGDQRLLAV